MWYLSSYLREKGTNAHRKRMVNLYAVYLSLSHPILFVYDASIKVCICASTVFWSIVLQVSIVQWTVVVRTYYSFDEIHMLAHRRLCSFFYRWQRRHLCIWWIVHLINVWFIIQIMSEVKEEMPTINRQHSGTVHSLKISIKRRRTGEFIARNSMLTDLFQVSHIKCVRNAFAAGFIIMILRHMVNDLLHYGR